MSNSGSIFLILILSTFIYWTRAYSNDVMQLRCSIYATRDIIDSGECKHGGDRNICGKFACFKGVNETCGETDMMQILPNLGKCATGLMCCHGVCSGCINGVCDQRMCIKKKATLRRAFNSFQDYI